MAETIAVPAWKKAIGFVLWGGALFFIGTMLFVIIAITFQDYLPNGPILLLLLVPCFAVAIWIVIAWGRSMANMTPEERRRRESTSEERREALRISQGQDQQAALQAEPGDFVETITALFKALFWIGVVGGGLYLAYLLISSLSVPVAIILGAIIIGLFILAAAG